MCRSTPITGADSTRNFPEAPYLEVAVAVIQGADGRFLLSLRSPDVHQGGRWEFPGGKLEPGEIPEVALRRELDEELGLLPTRYVSLITIPYHYPQKRVRLHVFRVLAYEGTPRGREGQCVAWFSLSELSGVHLPDANRGILMALQLPDRYLITPEPGTDDNAFISELHEALARGTKLVQLRAKTVSEPRLRRLASAAALACQQHGAHLMLNGTVALAREVGAHGIHLSASALSEMQPKKLPPDLWLGASCHNWDELDQAITVGVDFAVCSPVHPTPSHPDAQPIGWAGFSALNAQAPFPVYALGGMELMDIPQAQQCGGQGIAGIRGLWD